MTGHGWRHLVAVRPRREVPRVGWTLRVDYSDGTHDFIGYEQGWQALDGLARRMQTNPPGLARVTEMHAVRISEHDWRLHAGRTPCRAPDCAKPGDERCDRDCGA